MTTDSPRLLIYSQDGLGLGHLRRTTLLAAEYLAADPEASVLTISDSPIGQFFSAAPGHDFVKLPSIRKMSPGNWSPVRLSLPFDDVLSMRAEIIKTTALTFEPDVLLVDHMPHGAMGELLPTLETLRSLPVRVVLGLRDILGEYVEWEQVAPSLYRLRPSPPPVLPRLDGVADKRAERCARVEGFDDRGRAPGPEARVKVSPLVDGCHEKRAVMCWGRRMKLTISSWRKMI